MNIEVRKLKHFALLSEETDCFVGQLFIDNEYRGEVRNDGRGGCSRFTDAKAHAQIAEFAKSLPPTKTRFGSFAQDADSVISHLVFLHTTRKNLRRLMQHRVLFVENGKLLQTRRARTPEILAQWIAEMRNNKQRKVLNLLPLDAAVAAALATEKDEPADWMVSPFVNGHKN